MTIGLALMTIVAAGLATLAGLLAWRLRSEREALEQQAAMFRDLLDYAEQPEEAPAIERPGRKCPRCGWATEASDHPMFDVRDQ